MSQLTDYFKARIFMAMPGNVSVSKRRLAWWTARSLDLFEKTPAGADLLKRLPMSVYFSIRKTLNGNFGQMFAGGAYIGLACDQLDSLKKVGPVLMHECAHVVHNKDMKEICPNRSVFGDFLFEYLSEVGARLQEQTFIRECVQSRLLSYDASFFNQNINFYHARHTLADICQDVDQLYLNDFLQGGLAVSSKSEDVSDLRKIKRYFKTQYPVLTPQVYRHVQMVFVKKATDALSAPKRYRLTGYDKRLLWQCVSRERD